MRNSKVIGEIVNPPESKYCLPMSSILFDTFFLEGRRKRKREEGRKEGGEREGGKEGS